VAIEAEDDDDARAIMASSMIDLIITTCDDATSRSLLAELHEIDPAVPSVVTVSVRESWATIPDNALLLVEPLSLDSLERMIEVISRQEPKPTPVAPATWDAVAR
jgi:hypothetical protein